MNITLFALPHEKASAAARLADASGLDRTTAHRSHVLANHTG